MHARLSTREQRYLARARVCRVASADRSGATHVAPLCHAFDVSSQTVYVWTKGRTARNLRERARGAVECDDYFEDWDRLRGLVAHVRAQTVRSGRELSRARQLLKRKFKQYRQYADEDIEWVIGLRIVGAKSWGI
ncbi:MAG TPA: pyridoxamine 5'-phosphate oxidase family protein [bacterium]|jgi:nitroimidazol reductase NimA-like FMN-containing flavoprotein (pyridoxamine 5'-phosphate oxidase superfamily)